MHQHCKYNICRFKGVAYGGLLFFCFCVGVLAACKGGETDNRSTEDLAIADSIVTSTPEGDTIPYLPPETKEEKAEIDAKELKNKFSSAEDAIEYMKNSGQWDAYSSGILPSMAHENLEYCGKLLANPYNYFIVVDKATMKVVLFDKYGKVVKDYGMACAKNFGTKHKKADSRTPEGFFSAGPTYDSREWLFTDDNGVTHPQKGVYGPKFIRVSNPVTTQIGIHGTSSSGSIGKRVSHGCIRLNNNNIVDLVKYVKQGMPIIINPGASDKAVNSREGYRIASITTGVCVYKNAQVGPNKSEINTENRDTLSNDTSVVEKNVITLPKEQPTGSEEPESSTNLEIPQTSEVIK